MFGNARKHHNQIFVKFDLFWILEVLIKFFKYNFKFFVILLNVTFIFKYKSYDIKTFIDDNWIFWFFLIFSFNSCFTDDFLKNELINKIVIHELKLLFEFDFLDWYLGPELFVLCQFLLLTHILYYSTAQNQSRWCNLLILGNNRGSTYSVVVGILSSRRYQLMSQQPSKVK